MSGCEQRKTKCTKGPVASSPAAEEHCDDTHSLVTSLNICLITKDKWTTSDTEIQINGLFFNNLFYCYYGRKYEHINRSLSFHPIRQVPFHFMAGTIISPLPPSFQWKVRRTLAFSIHELAVILGDQLTAADLVPIFNGFLKDLDEVRIGVLKHLYDFLKVRYRSTAGPSVFKCGREMNGRRSETLSR